MTLLPACLCGSTQHTQERVHGLDILRCPCGIIRQRVDMSEVEYSAWYQHRYHDGVYYHTEDEDREVAKLRLRAYGHLDGRLLDVGSGNGAFVYEALGQGVDAWGQDLAVQSGGPRVYAEPLEDIHFPSCYFRTVTMHDVLEHVPDPGATLDEIHRILEDDGGLILDFPRFHHPAGLHHWKPVEHLWLLTDEQICAILANHGFDVSRIEHPVESKSVVYAWKVPKRKRTILVPPGIGDGWWVATKLPNLIPEGDVAEVWVHDSGPRRSEAFWSSLPWVQFGGYREVTNKTALDRAYKSRDWQVQHDIAGCEFFVSMNGMLDSGRSLDEVMGLTHWDLPLFRSKAERAKEAEFASRKPYVVLGYWNKGFYRDHWTPHWSVKHMLHASRMLMERGYDVVATGADWDRRDIMSDLCGRDRRIIDLVGKTSFSDLMALVRSSAGVLGFPAGSTMLGPFLGKPTVLLWAEKFPQAMWTNALPPRDNYLPIPVRERPNAVVDTLLALMGR